MRRGHAFASMRGIAAAMLLLSVACATAFGQEDARKEAREELNNGAREYADGNYAEAQQHFERALELDPSRKLVRLLVARAMMRRYVPGVDAAENRARGREAVTEYQRILDDDASNEEALSAVRYLFRTLRDDEGEQLWLALRAHSARLTPSQRADALAALAAKQWGCSYDLTEQNKETLEKPDGFVVTYRMPKSLGDFAAARLCASEGLRLAEQAVGLDAKNPNALSQKARLLRELMKLAEMEGNARLKADYEKLFAEALETRLRLSREALSKNEEGTNAPTTAPARDAEDAALLNMVQPPPLNEPNVGEEPARDPVDDAPPQPTPTPGASAGGTASGRVAPTLSGADGTVLSKPPPVYPREAMRWRAQGPNRKPMLGGRVTDPERYRAPALSPAARAEAEARLKEARERYERNPSDADAVIWLGRRTAYLGDFDRAIQIYTQGIRKHPRDARLYRHRGHRYITTRRFAEAIKDFERAAALIAGRPDEVEPDGLPNALNIPTSTLASNVWYHLGLAYYLTGDLRNALRAYRECLKFSKNPDMLAATSHWLYMTLRRLGRDAEAREVLAGVEDEARLIENHDYQRLLLMYKGKLKPEELLAEASKEGATPGYASVAYGVGNWYVYEERQPGKALRLYLELMTRPPRTSFGYIAAEADLERMGVRGYPRQPSRPNLY
jgi:tetratricopeptide (TPR) repeat protein